jgi:hypothetical protein
MRWFRRAPAQGAAERDAAQQEALLHEARTRFGPRIPQLPSDQVDALVRLLSGGPGLLAAVRIVRDTAEEAYPDVAAQVAELNRRTGGGYVLQGRNYRPLYRQARGALRTPLFALPCGFHPYLHGTAALTVIARQARRCVRVTDPIPLLANVFELIDLTSAGWEFSRVPVDVDAANLMHRLIGAAKELLLTMPEPLRLPPAVREMMRRNNTTSVYDPTGRAVVGGINLGAEMRPAFLT